MLIRLSPLLLGLIIFPVLAQTQTQMNEDACAEYRAPDKKLNTTYQQVISMHKSDTQFVKAFKKAQRAWLAYRDAQLEALYPATNKRVDYGSVYPMCDCLEQAALTKQRVEQLSGWLNAEEGDVCRGSR